MPTNFNSLDKKMDALIAKGLIAIGEDVKKRAIILAPVDSGDLRESAKVRVSTQGRDTVFVTFGNAKVEYARMRHFVNKKHPATRLYLSQALKSINNIGKYFKKI